MKTVFSFIALSILAFLLLTCISQPTNNSASGLSLDSALYESAMYFIDRLPNGAKIALVPFDTPTGRLSDYILEEMWNFFENSNKFTMVDRRNLARIETEIRHQYETGRVNENEIVSITRQHGAEILVYGQIVSFGSGSSEYRITSYATDIEKASSSQRALTVYTDNRLLSLLNVSLDDEVEHVMRTMARAVNQKTVIAVGRISYEDTQTVSSLSAWLKNSIISGAQKQHDKFQVATENESASFAVASRGFTASEPVAESSIQAVITGNYSPLDRGAEVSLRLISTTGNKAVIASQKFVIPASELERRKLSFLPEKNGVTISKTEFEAKQDAVDPYSGKNNNWLFTVTPDVLDGIYYLGDYMTMQLYSEQECYFRIIHIDVYGNSQVIYPVADADNNFIRAGETRHIPDNNRYLISLPLGEELILVSAYENPFIVRQSGISPLSPDYVSRGLTVESKNETEMTPCVTARFSYTVLPR